jgi:parallel beta-helix repeat protein
VLLLNGYGNVYASSSIDNPQQDAAPQTAAKTYVVDKNNIGGKSCNDAWPGTLSQPFCTIDKGIAILLPGDTLLVRKGNYPSFSVSKSGTAGNYITIAGYNAELPHVSGGQGIELKGTSYVAIKGFEVTGATGNWAGGILLTNSSTARPLYNIIQGNKVHDNTFANMSGIEITEGSYNKILYNDIYNNYFAGIRVTGASSPITDNEIGFNTIHHHTLAGADSDGISLSGSTITKTYIHDNIVHDNSDDGIDTWDSSNNIIIGNVSYNHVGVGDGNGFKLGGVNGGYNIIKNNIAYHNKARGFDSNGGSGNVYYQNVAYNNTGFGFQDAWRRNTSCTANSCPGIFINNIGYNNVKGNFSAGPSTLTSHNNIWYSDSGSPKASYNATVYSSLSAFYAASGNRLDNPNAGDFSSLQVNPQFVNPTGLQFNLLPSSPAIDHGDPANPGQVTALRRVDIGAFEYGINVMSVVNVVRANANFTNAPSVDFTVTFSRDATGVDAADFSLTTSGVSGVTVGGVSGSGSIYTVKVNTGIGKGTIRLNVVDNNSIVDANSNPLGGTALGDGNFTIGESYIICGTVKGDYNADCRKDIAVFRPGTGAWYISGQGNYVIGQSNDIPVPADYNGDRKVDVAVFRPSNSAWYIKDQGSFVYGAAGDIPVPADYNGDGKAEIAVFRPSNSTWYIKGVGSFLYGTVGDTPVVADYNGDGKADIAVFRPTNSTWYIKGMGPSLYGTVGDLPVVGDYNGDGKADIAVFRPSNSTWYIRGLGPSVYGAVGDIPVVGDYNGDGKADIAVFRPSNSTWYIKGIGPSVYGMEGDIPV